MPSAPLPWSTSLRAPSTLAHLPGSPEEQAGWRLRQLTGCCWWGQWPFYRAALFEMSQFSLEQARLHLHLHLPGVYRVTSLPVHPGLRQRFSRRGGQQPRLQGPDTAESPLPQQDDVQRGALASGRVDLELDAVCTGTSGNRCQRVMESDF